VIQSLLGSGLILAVFGKYPDSLKEEKDNASAILVSNLSLVTY
jgi:hypothetical protein